MNFIELFYLFFASIIAGALNSVAGGGSFFTFPALLSVGVPPVSANATNATVVWPGSIASLVVYRKEMLSGHKGFIISLSIVSLIGGIIGAVLLLSTPQKVFSEIVPFLLLFATLLFTFNKQISKLLGDHPFKFSENNPSIVVPAIVQFLISVYGGYFGGGMGVMMLSAFRFFAIKDIHFAIGLKLILDVLITGISVAIFIFAKAIVWKFVPLMVIGTIIGGYGGAYFARKLPQKYIYYFISIVGFSLSLYFFIK